MLAVCIVIIWRLLLKNRYTLYTLSNEIKAGKFFVTSAWRRNRSFLFGKRTDFCKCTGHCISGFISSPVSRKTITNQNLFHKEIKNRLNSWNACKRLVQNPLSSRLIYIDIKVKMQKTINSLLVVSGCETWSLTLREAHRLKISEKRVPMNIFWPKREEETKQRWRLSKRALHLLKSPSNIIYVIKSMG
jgi:hypothetical protein